VGRPTHDEQLVAEAASWCIEDAGAREEKIRRERIRHPKLIRDLLLDHLDTHRMDVLEVGGGPYPVSDLLRTRTRVVIDPLADEYREYFPCPDHIPMKAEELGQRDSYDLAICTNALDHVEDPRLVLASMTRALRPGGYLALMCAENNALTNPHPAHEWNLTAEWVHQQLDHIYETVWELTYARDGYRYGWVLWEGRRGQPAWALLLRKCSGYSEPPRLKLASS
jgi:SAM-dependent methyltransferase